MSKNFKVRGFNGANIKYMYHYLYPLLEKKPTYMIIMVGTNDAVKKSTDDIVAELLELKKHVETILPKCTVILSCPTTRFDKSNHHSQKVVFDLREKLINLKVPIIQNVNIIEKHLGKLGLHLNQHGLSRLALYYMRYMCNH